MAFDTDLNKLHPLLREKIKSILAVIKEENLGLELKEAYRTPEAQQKLARQGDLIQPWYSLAQYGLSCEFTEVSSGMRRQLSGNNRQALSRLSALAREHGLALNKTTLQLPFVNAEQLLNGNYPAGGHGGDAPWLQNLRHNIDHWPNSPKPTLADLDTEDSSDFSSSRELDEKSNQ